MPLKTVTQGNVTYTLGYPCKTHESGNNFLHVLISLDQSKVWGCWFRSARARSPSLSPASTPGRPGLGSPTRR